MIIEMSVCIVGDAVKQKIEKMTARTIERKFILHAKCEKETIVNLLIYNITY